LKFFGSIFFIIKLDEGCNIKALALAPSLELYLVDRIIESSIGFFSWLHHLSFIEFANNLAYYFIVTTDPPTPYASTTYARKLEAKFLVFGWPMGCFPKPFFLC
jgi:hypothetical protein